MLTIRTPQMEALQRSMRDRSIARIAHRLRASFHSRCQAMSDAALRQLVEEAVANAGRHGITGEADVFTFASIMLILGREFEEDPRFSWTADILDPRHGRPASVRMRALYEQVDCLLTDFPNFVP